MDDLLNLLVRLNELRYRDIVANQDDIDRLFPTFKKRVKKVADNGGIELIRTTAKYWEFKVASGTDRRKSYIVTIHWLNVENMLRRLILNGVGLFKNGKLDLVRLASRLMFEMDMKLNCSCPADLYWGFHYIRTKDKTKAGKGERRPPKIRNPKLRGEYCKHIDLVMQQLPFYAVMMRSWLNKHYGRLIEKLVKEKEEIERKEMEQAMKFAKDMEKMFGQKKKDKKNKKGKKKKNTKKVKGKDKAKEENKEGSKEGEGNKGGNK